MKRTEPKILSFRVDGKKYTLEQMEDTIDSWTIEGWEPVSITHFPAEIDAYTVLLQREVTEDEYRKFSEKRA